MPFRLQAFIKKKMTPSVTTTGDNGERSNGTTSANAKATTTTPTTNAEATTTPTTTPTTNNDTTTPTVNDTTDAVEGLLELLNQGMAQKDNLTTAPHEDVDTDTNRGRGRGSVRGRGRGRGNGRGHGSESGGRGRGGGRGSTTTPPPPTTAATTTTTTATACTPEATGQPQGPTTRRRAAAQKATEKLQQIRADDRELASLIGGESKLEKNLQKLDEAIESGLAFNPEAAGGFMQCQFQCAAGGLCKHGNKKVKLSCQRRCQICGYSCHQDCSRKLLGEENKQICLECLKSSVYDTDNDAYTRTEPIDTANDPDIRKALEENKDNINQALCLVKQSEFRRILRELKEKVEAELEEAEELENDLDNDDGPTPHGMFHF